MRFWGLAHPLHLSLNEGCPILRDFRRMGTGTVISLPRRSLDCFVCAPNLKGFCGPGLAPLAHSAHLSNTAKGGATQSTIEPESVGQPPQCGTYSSSNLAGYIVGSQPGAPHIAH